MGLSNSFSTGLSGLAANSRNLDIIGNNIANVNTPGFKSSRAQFTAQFLQSLSAGSPPGGDSGGTNPKQIGLGTRLAGVQQNFTNGGIEATGINTNMAIEGDGFFVVEQAGERLFTRDGQFSLNSENVLTGPTGARVQGFGVDGNFNIATGAVEDIQIPLGTMTVAEETGEVSLEGNLNSNGELPSSNSVHESRTFFTDAGLTPGNEETGGTNLTTPGNDLYVSDGAGGSQLALQGGTDTVITVESVEKGGRALASKTFAFSTDPTVTDQTDAAGTTLNDFANFLEEALGLTSASFGGETLGGSVAFASGQLTVTGNEGDVNNMDLSTTDFTATSDDAGFTAINNPFVMSKPAGNPVSNGESARTVLEVFDSLGTSIPVQLSMVKQSVQPDGGTTWTWLAESDENAAVSQILGGGSVQFDQAGNFVSASNSSFSIQRDNGANDPLTVALNFDDDGVDAVTALAATESSLAQIRQDGAPLGTLSGFSVGNGGEITGSFTNGLARTIGQVALGTFINNDGLEDAGNNLMRPGANSGNPVIAAPQQFGGGRVIAGALEQSNVDLSAEFVELIGASTGFSANSRVITTTDEMIQELLLLSR